MNKQPTRSPGYKARRATTRPQQQGGGVRTNGADGAPRTAADDNAAEAPLNAEATAMPAPEAPRATVALAPSVEPTEQEETEGDDDDFSLASLTDEEHAARDAEAEIADTAGRESVPELDRRFSLPSFSFAEIVGWVLAIGAALLTRLASLTNMPLSTPEAQRAFAAWQWTTGYIPPADGATLVNGQLWGPFSFLQTGLFFFLFGARDSVGRIGPALAGVALVAACLWLRPHFGKWGALGAAALIALSPSFVFGSRQLSGVPWAALAGFVLFVCILRLADARPTRSGLFLLLGAGVVLLSSGPEGLTLLLTLALALALAVAFAPSSSRGNKEQATARNAIAAEEADVGANEDEPTEAETEATHTPVGIAAVGANLGAVDRRLRSAGIVFVAVLALALFSLLFTNIAGVPRTLGSVFGEWGGSLFTATRNEPWFYYLLIAFNYEMAIGVTTIVGLVLLWRMKSPRPFALTLAATWQVMALVVFSLTGNKSPEAMLLLLLPAALTGGVAWEWAVTQLSGAWFWRERAWLVGVGACVTLIAAAQFLREIRAVDRSPIWIATIFALIIFLCVAGYFTATLAAKQRPTDARNVLVATLLLLSGVIGVRAMTNVVFTSANDPRELLVGTRTAGGLTAVIERIERISTDLTRNPQFRTFDPQRGDRANIAGGKTMSIVADPSVRWPLAWYFRDYPNFVVQEAGAAAQSRPNGTDGTPLPQIVVTQAAAASLAGPQLTGYMPQNYAYNVSFPAGYRAESPGTFFSRLTNGAAWSERLNYFLTRATAQPPVTTDLTIFFSPEVASRVFYTGTGGGASGSTTPAQQSFGLFERGGRGKAEGQFVSPRGIGIGPDGTITVVDQLNYRVQQFGPDGAFLRQFGGPGTTPDKFGQLRGYAFGPTGLAVAPDGTLYVADTWNHRVSVFSADGKPLRQWGSFFNGQDDAAGLATHPGDFYGPRGIAIGPDGNVYVTDGGNGRVSVFRPDGTFVRTIGSRGSGPGQLLDTIGIAVKADGTVAVADPDNGRVQLFAANGMFLSAIPVPDWATLRGQEPYILWLPNGNLLLPAPTTNRLYEVTQAGMTVRTITGNVGDLRRPVGLALTPDGATVLVTNEETHSVTRISLK